jgi:hypothetical protein
MRTVLSKKNIILGMLTLGLVPAAWGGISACPASVEQTLSSTVVGAGQGCNYLNANFLNFNVSAATGTNTFYPATTGSNTSTNIEFAPSGTPIYTLDFQTIATNVIGSGADPLPCTANTWCVQETGAALTASQSFTFGAVATTGSFYGLTLTDGTVQPHNLNFPDVITTIEAFCVGISTFTCATNGGTYGYIEVVQTENNLGGTYGTGFTTSYVVCAPGVTTCVLQPSPASAYLGFALPTTSIGIQNTVTITLGAVAGGVEPVFLDSFNDGFETTPEPSTFILMGSALAGLGLLGARRKRA